MRRLIKPLLIMASLLLLGTSLWTGPLHAQDPLPPHTFAGACGTWVLVNDGGFGLTAPTSDPHPYHHEEGFEVAVFNGQLYVGMEADDTLGARLWRTQAGVRVPARQADWEEVAAVEGAPFGNTHIAQNDHIDSLATFKGRLYASTANHGSEKLGTVIYSSTTGAVNSWYTVTRAAGFGDINNTNLKDMVVFPTGGTDWLCGGTQNNTVGAEVWCTYNGITWTQKNNSGFGDPANNRIASMDVFSGGLYVGMNSTTGNVWRTTDLVTWTQVFTAHNRPSVEIVGALSDTLYIAAGAVGGLDEGEPLYLYRSTTGDAGTWLTITTPLTADVHNTRTIVDGATGYNGALYIAVMNNNTGVEVWRTTGGTDWVQVNADGFGYSTTFAAELIPFEGYLYAWTSDYTRGQQVWRSGCPIAQAHAITQTGRVDFAGVGASVTLTHGIMDGITVSVLPGALPTTQTHSFPVARTYHLAVAPATATFTADITLAYTAAELTSANATSDTLYLTRWDGIAWVDCPQLNRANQPAVRTVTCRDVADFSTWAIAGIGGVPAAVRRAVRLSDGPRWIGGMLLGISVVVSSTYIIKRKLNADD